MAELGVNHNVHLKKSPKHSSPEHETSYNLKLNTNEFTKLKSASINNLNGRVKEEDESLNNFDVEYDGLSYRDSVNSEHTLQRLNVLRKNRQLCDLVLQLDEDSQEIYCHQIILACNSRFFMELFNDYELEQIANSNNNNNELFTTFNSNADETQQENGQTKRPNSSLLKRNSIQTILNKNSNCGRRQLLLSLSSFLQEFLNDNYQHHYAKLNNITNHNSHFHHHYAPLSHLNNLNHNIDDLTTVEQTHQINQNLDYEALKICVDYCYTSHLKVPSYLIPHVYTLAYHLSFNSIVKICCSYLIKQLNVDNCLSIRSFALDETLIEASTNLIEKNIEYILQLQPGRSQRSLSSSSTSSLNEQTSGKNALQSLSCSLNLAHKEFNHLPRINIELVGLKEIKYTLPDNMLQLTQLCMNWLVKELKRGINMNTLCDNLNMLYMNQIDHTLHDCCDMESSNSNFNDYVNDYQKQHLVNGNLHTLHNHNSINNGHSQSNVANQRRTSPIGNVRTFKITDEELNSIGHANPIRVKTLHDNEIVCSHQTGENSFMNICTLNGKLVAINAHFCMVKNDLKADVDSKAEINGASNEQDVIQETNKCAEVQGESEGAGCVQVSNQNVSNVEFARLSKLSMARCSHGVVSYNNKLYIIGGYDRSECIDLCEVFDPFANTIEFYDRMPCKRGRAATALFKNSNTFYVMGGSDGHEDLNSLESYNFDNKKWTTVKFDFDIECTEIGYASCDESIYLVGLNQKKGGKRKCCLKYIPSTNTFNRLADLNNSRAQCALVYFYSSNEIESNNNANKKFLYVFGGYDQIRCLNSAEVYNFNEDKWTLLNNMHEARRGAGAALHQATQQIFVVGGTNGSKSLKSIEIYDIKAKKWTMGPELNIARNNVCIAFIGMLSRLVIFRSAYYNLIYL
jgi:influenza virus NS1A-binding protein